MLRKYRLTLSHKRSLHLTFPQSYPLLKIKVVEKKHCKTEFLVLQYGQEFEHGIL